jgi:hypothetical protein
MSRTLPLGFLAALVLAPAATAQPEQQGPPPMVALSFWRCQRSAMDQIVQYDHERMLPIMQSFVDSGRLFESGTFTHAWGDQFNYVSYLVAPDIASIAAIADESQSAYEERYPGDTFFLDNCDEHFDNIYSVRTGSGFTGTVSPDEPATVVLSFWKCPLQEIGRLMRNEATSQPVADALRDEGLWRGSGFMTHAWGDSWNVVRYTGGDDLEQVLSTFDVYAERMEDVEIEGANINNTCSAHRDNIYDFVVRTTPLDD